MLFLVPVPIGIKTCMENRKLKALYLFHVKMNFLGTKLSTHLLTLGEIYLPKDPEARETYFSVSLDDQLLGLSASTSVSHGLKPCKRTSQKPLGY